MIERPKGRMNELVYLYTTYHDSMYRRHLTVTELFHLLSKLLASNELTTSLRITPFYVNEKLGFQEELDLATFYVECRANTTTEERFGFAKENMFWLDPASDYKILEQYITLEDMKRSHFLIESEDMEGFQTALCSYKTFLLDRGIPQMMKWLFDTTNLTIEDLPYGYFCFEILSS